MKTNFALRINAFTTMAMTIYGVLSTNVTMNLQECFISARCSYLRIDTFQTTTIAPKSLFIAQQNVQQSEQLRQRRGQFVFFKRTLTGLKQQLRMRHPTSCGWGTPPSCLSESSQAAAAREPPKSRTVFLTCICVALLQGRRTTPKEFAGLPLVASSGQADNSKRVRGPTS